jgi:hypothetical protein
VPPLKTISASAPSLGARKRWASPKPKKRKSTLGRRSLKKVIRLAKEMVIIDGQNRTKLIQSYLENLDLPSASSPDKRLMA